MSKYTHIVTEDELGMTINQILRANYKFSARFKTKMKYHSLVDLNGVPTRGYVIPVICDVIGIRLPEEHNDFEPEDIPLKVLYEDDDLLVIDKQPGIICHPTKGHPTHTIANAVVNYMNNNGDNYKVRFANRIDMDTSGIVIIAKNANSQNDISSQMRAKSTVKKYIAVVHGNISEDAFTINLPVGRPDQVSIQRCVMYEGGKDAITDVKVLERYSDKYTLVELTLHTGRTHQIRVHLSHIGHPIVGDYLYGGEAPEFIDRQALHAICMELKHPITGDPLRIEAEYPDDITECINRIKRKG